MKTKLKTWKSDLAICWAAKPLENSKFKIFNLD